MHDGDVGDDFVLFLLLFSSQGFSGHSIPHSELCPPPQPRAGIKGMRQAVASVMSTHSWGVTYGVSSTASDCS